MEHTDFKKNRDSSPSPDFIKNLFNQISPTYDKANDALTFGLARLWRKSLVRWCSPLPGDSILDCATGTGDLALEFKKHVGSLGQVIGTDFSQGMLLHAPKKAQKLGLNVQFEVADATQLPYQDKIFNHVSISYGIRNVSDPLLALKEMARVCKSGGFIMILETGDNKNPFFKRFFKFYFNEIVPLVGGWISKNTPAYDYLNRSSQKFPSGKEFVQLALSSGQFSQIEYKQLLFGASYLYRCKVI